MRAWQLKRQGRKQKDIAAALGVTEGAVSQWLKRAVRHALPGRRCDEASPAEQLPAYAPELNPEEGIWNLCKRVELRNVRCQDLAHLEDEVRLAVRRLRQRRSVLRAGVRGCGYAV